MPKNRTATRARLTIRLFGRGVFVGLLGLALTMAILSFLTACICDDMYNAAFLRHDEIKDSPSTEKTAISNPARGN